MVAFQEYRQRIRGDLQGVRIILYVVLLIFSIILMGITAGRISQTERGDPFNDFNAYYEPVVVELLVCSLLMIGISIFFTWTILTLREFQHASRLWFECAVLGVIWLMLLVGAAVASDNWPNLNLCVGFSYCRLLQAMLAFAWLCWIILTFLLTVSLIYAIRFKSWGGHVHSWKSWNSKPTVTVRA